MSFISSPLSIWFILPVLHLMLGTEQNQIAKINQNRKRLGWLLLAVSAILFSGLPWGYDTGVELGLFYWLFAFMPLALVFLLTRIWHPKAVIALSVLSILGGALHVISFF